MNKPHNYAFIDSTNLVTALRNLGWPLDFARFRRYLQNKYNIDKAYLFIGFIDENQELYDVLSKQGYELIFKPTYKAKDGTIKGNCDAELVLQAMVDYNVYDQAMIITSDGDFFCLVKYLNEQNKLLTVIAPDKYHASVLLGEAAGDKIEFMNGLRRQLEYKKKIRPAESVKPDTPKSDG